MPKKAKYIPHIDKRGVNLDAELSTAIKAAHAYARDAVYCLEVHDYRGMAVKLEMLATYTGGSRTMLERIADMDSTIRRGVSESMEAAFPIAINTSVVWRS